MVRKKKEANSSAFSAPSSLHHRLMLNESSINKIYVHIPIKRKGNV